MRIFILYFRDSVLTAYESKSDTVFKLSSKITSCCSYDIGEFLLNILFYVDILLKKLTCWF